MELSSKLKEGIKMHGIEFDGVKKYLDTTLLLKNISFQIKRGERVGIIGDNGCGKTTILKLMAGILKLNHCDGYPYAPVPPGYDEGWIKKSKGLTCSYLEQIPEYDDSMKVIDVLNLNFREARQIEEQMHEVEEKMAYLEGPELKKILNQYSKLMQLYESKGGYDQQEKLSKLCKGLKLNQDILEQKFNSLSGGEKTNVMTGKLIIDSPDVLLLDEPTNHLDMESVEWLQDYLRDYKGTVVVISHDRYFLDSIATKIIEVENKVCKTYKGNFTDYQNQKEKDIGIQLNDYNNQRKQLNNMQSSIQELRRWAMKSDNNKFYKRAASIQIKMEKMKRIENPYTNQQNMKVNIKSKGYSSKCIIEVEGLTAWYDKKNIFNEAKLLVRGSERVALVGANGSGKTTLLKILLGELAPDGGKVFMVSPEKIAYLPQNISFENEELTVLEYFRQGLTVLEGKAREYLSQYMFYGGNVFKKLKLLSGGERARLELSKLLFGNVNLLILDEPTNHLDIKSIESIEVALSHFKGTILLVSHDRCFINNICNRVVAIEDQAFSNYLGNYDHYKIKKSKKIKS